jgi:Bifunctional DNA primase/polymerase, N-terminal
MAFAKSCIAGAGGRTVTGATLNAALDYAARDWQVFPLRPKAKEPATRRGFYDATTNPATLRRWFEKFPYNLGIRTGTASGIFVFDADGAVGFASLAEIEFAHGRLPQTLASDTGKGRHFWFTISVPISCSTGMIAPGIDIRGDGGYAVAPPSVHPNGKTYRWLDDSLAPAEAPDWLLELARKKPPTISERARASINPPGGAPGAYGLAALDDETAALANTPRGCRNHALNRAAFCLFQLVAGGELERDHVIARLIEACHRNGLIKDDGLRSVQATMRSAYRAGFASPRSRGAA